MTRDELKTEIADAFADVPYPGDDLIVYSPEAPEARRYHANFSGKHWREVIDPEFLQLHTAIPLFSLRGSLFYLPAYLIAAVDYPDDAWDWVDAWTKILYPRLDPPWPSHLKEDSMQQWNQMMNALTVRQKHAIRLFLEYVLATQPDAWWLPTPPGHLMALMLANYWGEF